MAEIFAAHFWKGPSEVFRGLLANLSRPFSFYGDLPVLEGE